MEPLKSDLRTLPLPLTPQLVRLPHVEAIDGDAERECANGAAQQPLALPGAATFGRVCHAAFGGIRVGIWAQLLEALGAIGDQRAHRLVEAVYASLE